MNKTYLAMMVLEQHLDVWEPMVFDGFYFIRNKENKIFIGKGKSLKAAILKARDYEINKLKNRK